jgi:hypothetical protein
MIPSLMNGAQWASRRTPGHLAALAVLATVLAVGGLTATPGSADASGFKVVIVVGPAHSSTAKYIDAARRLASQARSYGAAVSEIYSPNATWAKVRTVAQGAKLLIYLGHGNGHPSPYGVFSRYSKDGMGLNRTAGNGHANVRYYGEYYMANYIDLAKNAVVILNRLCYASGNSEPGMALPSKSTAVKRVDNFGAGFLRTGARAVFAEGIGSTGFVLSGLFTTDSTIRDIFWSDPRATRSYAFSFSSARTTGKSALLDPYRPGKYYRSVIGDLAMTAADWRG